jgi:hypothetical protein
MRTLRRQGRWSEDPGDRLESKRRNEITQELEKFHSWFSEENLDAIRAARSERDREEAEATYQAVADKISETSTLYRQLFDEEEYLLRPLRASGARLRLFGNGRLARLDMKSGGSPLYYLTKNRQTAAYVGLVFSRDSRGKWMPIR